MISLINCLSLNVGTSASLAGVSTIIEFEKVDIVFLQEVRITGEQIECLLRGFKAVANVDHEDSSRPGVALAWRQELPVQNVCNLVMCRLQIASLGSVKLLNIYAPSGSSKKTERHLFYTEDVFPALQVHSHIPLIWAGDYNCVLHSVDLEDGKGFMSKKCPALSEIVVSSKLIDPFRTLFPHKREFTFFRPGCAASRLDRFYISKYLESSIVSATHIPSLSDHSAVKLCLSLNIDTVSSTKFTNKSYWKLNTAILKEENFITSFRPFWSFLLTSQDDFSDIADWWDLQAKPKIRQFCMDYSVQRKYTRDQCKKYLLASLQQSLMRKDWEEVARHKEELSTMINMDAMGLVIRSRFQQNAEEERASVYHSAKELRGKKGFVSALNINGVPENDETLIEDHILKYFNALFNGHHDSALVDTGRPFEPENRFLSQMLQDLTKMDDHDIYGMEDEITCDEIEYVLKHASLNKSPGLDGLSYEFYQTTWPLIKETFVRIIRCQLDRCRLTESNTFGATRLCSKVQGIPKVDELRPITLLNCDYKVLSKLLVLRMKPVLPKIIKSGQLCTVGKKNILFGVNNVISSVLYANMKNVGACLMSLDFFKAYDRVYLPFLIKVMEAMGFGGKFCSWVKMLHFRAKTRFILNGLSRFIEVSFSIRQGDPIAMLLYIIYVEPLLIYIEKRIVGLKIENMRQSVEAFCDDINIITSDINDLVIVDEAVKLFEKVSGAILSRNVKCKVIGFASWKNRNDWPLPYLSTVCEIKVFGVFVMNSYRCMINRNWEFRFEKLQKCLMSWSSRYLESIFQRVDVVNTFALSRIFYVASVLPLPKNVIQRIEKIVGNFVWTCNGKVLRVSLEDVKLPRNRGGLGLICVDRMGKSLRVSQLLRLLKDGDTKSLHHIDYWMGDLLADLSSNLGHSQHPRSAPSFFMSLAENVAEDMMSGTVSVSNWRQVTNRVLYNRHISLLRETKAERDLARPLLESWRKLYLPCVTSATREILYLAVHNKLPVRERTFRIGLIKDPYCSTCLETRGAFISDREHVFCSCEKVEAVWTEVRTLLESISPAILSTLTNLQMITLDIPKIVEEDTFVWIIGHYMNLVWKYVHIQGIQIGKKKVFGFLKFKYKVDQLGARRPLKRIQLLSS